MADSSSPDWSASTSVLYRWRAGAAMHRTQEEVYIVIAGSGRVKLDDEVHDLRQLDVIRVPPDRGSGIRVRP